MNVSWNVTKQCFLLSYLCCLGITLSGCSQDDGRLSLHGTVTFDGTPLPTGNIKFLPQSGTPGPTAGGPIEDGSFSIAADGGTMPGSFRIEITATRKTGNKVYDSTAEMMDPSVKDGMVDEIEQYIPARYNQNSNLTADVHSDGDNHFEFVLQSS